MKLYLYVENDGSISGVSSTPEEFTVEVEVHEKHPVLATMAFGRYRYIDGELVEDLMPVLIRIKNSKLDELELLCETSITRGFPHTLNGVEYFFSFDLESQINLQESERLFEKGIVEEELWTVRCSEECQRACTEVLIDSKAMRDIMAKARLHKSNNIYKYRKLLTPMVQSATTVEEVEAINWDNEDILEGKY